MNLKEQMLQEVKDAKDAEKARVAYDKAMPMPDTSFPAPSAPAKPDDKKAVQAKPFAKGGKVSSASKRADGIAQRGKTKGRMC